MKFGVGVLVVSSIGVGIILVFLFGAFPSVLNRDYTVQVVFPSAQGIHKDSPVYRDGVQIGRVRGIRLIDEGGVLVTLALDSDKKLTHRYIPRIGAANLVTGDADLEFVRATQRELDQIFAETPDLIDRPYGEEFADYGTTSNSLLSMQDDISSTLRAIQDAGQSVASAGENINKLAVDATEVIGGTDTKIDRVSDEAVKALEEFQGVIRDLRKIVGDPKLKANVDRSAEQLPALLGEATTALQKTQETFDSFKKVGDRFDRVGQQAETAIDEVNGGVADARIAIKSFQKAAAGVEKTVASADRALGNADRTFQNLAEVTQPFARNRDQVYAEVIRTIQGLQRTLGQAEQFARSLNNSDGTVKRLLDDDEIYYSIRRSIENIERGTAKLRPILDDVRIFSDKVARDPRQLGVRGAITKRPNGAGLK
ncbi:MAG: MlaD family protein [Planctomycetota bacterium]